MDLTDEQACPACGDTRAHTLFHATDRLFRTTDKSFLVIECSGCRLVRLYPWPSPSELRHYYPEDYWYVPAQDTAGHFEDVYRRFVLRDHVGFVQRAMKNSGEHGLLLDVGCGSGMFLKLMKDRGHRVAGLDFSCEAASVAWRRNGIPTVCATLSRAPVRPASCSAITMFHVLEHLYNPAAYLEVAHTLLRPEGRLIVQVPNAACWQFLLLGENWNGVDVPRHLLNFRAKDMEVLLDNCGFEVVRTKYFSLRDNPAGFATSLAPALDPVARRMRKVEETPRMRLFKDLVYFGLVVAALPFTMLEAACRAGSTVMMEARKKKK